MRFAPAFALLLLLAPTAAAAWSIEVAAPAIAPSGLPFLVRACVAAEPGARVEMRASLDEPRGRYGPATVADPQGRACVDLEVVPPDEERNATLVVRARPEGREAKADTRVPVRLARAGVEPILSAVPVESEGVRVPSRGGIALIPRFGGGVRLALESAWGPPFDGFVLRNDGVSDARTRGLHVGEKPLPDATLAPGERVFFGERAPPDVRGVTFEASRNFTLSAAALTLARLDAPKLGAGERFDGERQRAGLTAIPAAFVPSRGRLEAFVQPEAGAAPFVRAIDEAREEVLVEAYTLTSGDVAAALGRSLDRGVRVRMLLEGAPVGGVEDEQQALVAALVARGADVFMLRSAPGFPARYATLHAKVLVIDRATLVVSTENLGSFASRGFGVVAREPALAVVFARAFEADAAPWPDVQAPVSLPPPATLAAAPARVEARPFAFEGAWRAAPVLSPDAPGALIESIDGARERVDVAMLFAQPRFGSDENPFLDAIVRAARRNVSVRLLLDGALDEGENEAVAARLNALAAREGLPLEARLRSGGTLHAKLVLLDGEVAYVGSMNWGEASMEKNREMGLLIEAAPLVEFWRGVFAADFEAQDEEAPERRETPGWGIGWLAGLLTLRRRRARGASRPR